MKHGLNMDGYVISEIDNSWEMLLRNNETEFILKPEYIIDTHGQRHYKYFNYNEIFMNQRIITNVSPIEILISVNTEKFRCMMNRICRTANNHLVEQLSS